MTKRPAWDGVNAFRKPKPAPKPKAKRKPRKKKDPAPVVDQDNATPAGEAGNESEEES